MNFLDDWGDGLSPSPQPNLEGQAELQLKAAHRRGAGCRAEACVLRQLTPVGDAAVSGELAVLQRHARRRIESSRRAPGVELHRVQSVKDIRSELEPAGLLELPEAEPPHHRRVHVIRWTAAHVQSRRIHAHTAVTRSSYNRGIEL